MVAVVVVVVIIVVVVVVVVIVVVVVVVVVVAVTSINVHRLENSKITIFGHSEINFLTSKDHRQNGKSC